MNEVNDMQKIKVISPENIEIEYTLAGLGSRAGAVMIDYLIQGLALITIWIILFFVFFKNIWEFDAKAVGYIMGGSLIIMWAINYLYFVISEMVMNGSTLGKRVFKLRTVRKNGMPITLKHSMIRNLFRDIIDNFFIGIVMIFFRKDKKRIGDMVSSTMVIAEDARELQKSFEVESNVDKRISILTDEENDLLKDFFARRAEMEEIENSFSKIYDYFWKNYGSEEKAQMSREEFLKSLI